MQKFTDSFAWNWAGRVLKFYQNGPKKSSIDHLSDLVRLKIKEMDIKLYLFKIWKNVF